VIGVGGVGSSMTAPAVAFNHRRCRGLVRLLLVPIVSVFAVFASSAAAGAGGWAISTLDEVPVFVPGEATPVGFTILQHGVRPVDLAQDVGIEVTAPDGTTSYFAAAPDGTTGHYVATVTFPNAGDFTWRVRQGWFGPHDLGPITIDDRHAATGGRAGTSWLRPVLVSSTIVLAAFAIVNTIVTRRRTATIA
jgi:hypothetical protein